MIVYQSFQQLFQSTSSARRTTTGQYLYPLLRTTISIHVLREEDDQKYTNKRSKIIIFQSTSSARRTTQCCKCCACFCKISIHVLREEDD